MAFGSPRLPFLVLTLVLTLGGILIFVFTVGLFSVLGIVIGILGFVFGLITHSWRSMLPPMTKKREDWLDIE